MDETIKPVNCEAIFNPINNGFFYLCSTETPGLYWVRSVAGNWVQIKGKPMHFDVLQADFEKFIASGKTSSELEVKNDNTDQVVVEPKKDDSPVDISNTDEIKP